MTVHPEFDDAADATISNQSVGREAEIEEMFAASSFGEPDSIEAAAVGARARARRAERWPKPCGPVGVVVGKVPSNIEHDSPDAGLARPQELREGVRRRVEAIARELFLDRVLNHLRMMNIAGAVCVLVESADDPDVGPLSAHQLAVLVREGGEVDIAESLIAHGQRLLTQRRLADLRSIQARVSRQHSASLVGADAELLFLAACSRHVRGEFGAASRLYRFAEARGFDLASVGVETLTIDRYNEVDSLVVRDDDSGSLFVYFHSAFRDLAPLNVVGWDIRWWDVDVIEGVRDGLRKRTRVDRCLHQDVKPATFVGRSLETPLIDFGLRLSEAGTSEPPVLSGSAGVGKTRVASEAVEYLVELASEGRRGGVQQLLQLALPVVSRYCESRLLDLPEAGRTINHVAVSVVGDVFKSLSRPRDGGLDFVSLVYSICLENVDRARARVDDCLSEDVWIRCWLGDSATSTAWSTASAPDGSERLAVGLINHLPPKQREVLILAIVGLSDDQAARAVKVDLPGLRAARYRAVEELREMLTQKEFSECARSGPLDRSAVETLDARVEETLRRIWERRSCR